jgi:hypothetical protein
MITTFVTSQNCFKNVDKQSSLHTQKLLNMRPHNHLGNQHVNKPSKSFGVWKIFEVKDLKFYKDLGNNGSLDVG